MIYVIMPSEPSQQLMKMVEAATKEEVTYVIKSEDHLPNLQNKKILFAVELGEFGADLPLLQLLSVLHQRGNDSLKSSVGALVVHSDTELFTKSASAEIIFRANQMGCGFIGHPLVEATGSMRNFKTWQKTLDLSLEEISLRLSSQLGLRLREYSHKQVRDPKIAVLHSSSRATSNTLSLWSMISKGLKNPRVQELYIRNGSVFDCYGCSYKTCMKFSEQSSCFYGGVMTEDILPAIEESDSLVWICPNYNDSISSNLMAVINRLTTLYRRMNFYDKSIFSVIVSGNSGSDSIARQLIDALNINKGFYLPPYFSIMAIANDKGSIWKIPQIERRAFDFGEHISSTIRARDIE
ncbi:flavodoxin family protein [Alkaliphilus hydrothermalis]|uniref:Multimeric flavodoxin WrbA n=1 Tax=Alkaliphilus hydrothermalis TaxID=1482730 RepID=A0ABS2NMY4_9FIRM|nr:NAD(P)H-dependent oxidoreductase [Alkaliphilus hydrothermalis]MBM7614309.1 multimeric flavodoxin WrbA [Alkaliphilus hydrothermalis]